jgi:transketolase
VKGKGVSFMEDNPKYHGVAPTQEELVKALQEIG